MHWHFEIILRLNLHKLRWLWRRQQRLSSFVEEFLPKQKSSFSRFIWTSRINSNSIPNIFNKISCYYHNHRDLRALMRLKAPSNCQFFKGRTYYYYIYYQISSNHISNTESQKSHPEVKCLFCLIVLKNLIEIVSQRYYQPRCDNFIDIYFNC